MLGRFGSGFISQVHLEAATSLGHWNSSASPEILNKSTKTLENALNSTTPSLESLSEAGFRLDGPRCGSPPGRLVLPAPGPVDVRQTPLRAPNHRPWPLPQLHRRPRPRLTALPLSSRAAPRRGAISPIAAPGDAQRREPAEAVHAAAGHVLLHGPREGIATNSFSRCLT